MAVLGVDEREVLPPSEQTVKVVIGVRVKRARRVARREPNLALHEIAREAAAQARRKLNQQKQRGVDEPEATARKPAVYVYDSFCIEPV